MNFGWAYNDYAPERMYADAIRSMRIIGDADNGNTEPAPSDLLGPTIAHPRLVVLSGLESAHGTYALRFKGQVSGATVENGHGVIVPMGGSWSTAYSCGYTTATVTFTRTDGATFALYLTGAYRDGAYGVGVKPGLTELTLMRPLTPGSTSSYALGTLFTNEAIALARKFECVRWMDFVHVNDSQQQNWSDRTDVRRYNMDYKYRGSLPVVTTGTSTGNDRGGPWEDVVRFSNAANRDAWITMPLLADDDYVTKVAQVFKNGSDGSTPYTSVQAVPLYPPLNSNLHLYVEYSNEIWNPGFSQWQTNINKTNAEVAAYAGGIGLLSYDGQTNGLDMRRQAKRTVEISNLFRGVFGDAAMGSRVRVILAGQQNSTYTHGALGWIFNVYQLGLADSYLNAASFPTRAADGQHHPLAYFIYGGGGSTYYWPSDTTSVANALTTRYMAVEPWVTDTQLANAQAFASLGLKRIAYEGGPDYGAGGANEGAAMMTFRSSGTPNMTDVFEAHHRAWNQLGGDLNVYYRAGDAAQWGFLSTSASFPNGNVFDLNSPKLVGVTELSAASPDPIKRVGTAVGSSAAGGACGLAYFNAPTRHSTGSCSGSGTLNVSSNVTPAYDDPAWAAYSFLESAGTVRTVNLTITNPSGTVTVYVDGEQACSQAAAASVSCPAGTVTTGLHGIVVRAVNGSFTLDQVSVQ